MKSKLQKTLILGISGIVLLGIGLVSGSNPTIQDSVQNAKEYIELPTSHADNDDTFDLSKRVTSKQFTVEHDIASGGPYTFSGMNKQVSKKVDKYLSSVNNLSDYHIHISKIDTVQSGNNDVNDSETATITFIRK